MVLLSAEGLSRDLGERVLFDQFSIGISEGDKIALVAPNGTGKSTLLKILAGEEEPDKGLVTLRQGTTLGYLAQEPDFKDAHTVQDVIDTVNNEITRVIRHYEDTMARQAEHPDQEQLQAAINAMDRTGAWEYDRRLKELLTRFRITDFNREVNQLSGGEKKRLAIAIVLLRDPAVLLLDEPTNHLDISMIEWLEDFLSKSRTSLLMVTHDRYFLDNVCNQIVELADGQMYVHNGNYTHFLEKKAERELVDRVTHEKDRQRLQAELEWMRRSPKARTTKARSRITGFYDLQEKVSGRQERSSLKLDMKENRIGGKILEMMKVRKHYGEQVILDGFDYVFRKGERVGIVGDNGSGKSTFLNLITGTEEQDSGKINRGDTVIFGYYTQEGMDFKPGMKVIDVLTEVAEVITLSDGKKITASQLLNRFMFPPKVQQKPVDVLSGGEKRRLHLMRVLMKNPNFLVLDEPTNDLDLETLVRLEEYLASFKGCLITVSHDRYFLDHLVDHIFVFEGNGVIRDFIGTFSELRVLQAEKEDARRKQQMAEKKTAKPPERIQNREQRLSYKEQLEYNRLESEISSLEEEKKELEGELNAGGGNYEQLTLISRRIGELITQIDTKTERWVELDERNSNG